MTYLNTWMMYTSDQRCVWGTTGGDSPWGVCITPGQQPANDNTLLNVNQVNGCLALQTYIEGWVSMRDDRGYWLA
ncbi:MAG: hypothetical protein ACRDEA_04370, partial [Microcystaceae cyanobacterium]